MNANLAHEFRTPFAAINVSLNSLNKVFPVLLESHVKSCEAGLVDTVYRKDFLDILDKSIKNSLSEIKFCEFYLNKLLLLIKDRAIGNNYLETINLKASLDGVVMRFQPIEQCI
jgi:signal transduction histidine kinase